MPKAEWQTLDGRALHCPTCQCHEVEWKRPGEPPVTQKVFLVESGSYSGPVYEGQLEDAAFTDRAGAVWYIQRCYDRYTAKQRENGWRVEPLSENGDVFEAGEVTWTLLERTVVNREAPQK